MYSCSDRNSSSYPRNDTQPPGRVGIRPRDGAGRPGSCRKPRTRLYVENGGRTRRPQGRQRDRRGRLTVPARAAGAAADPGRPPPPPPRPPRPPRRRGRAESEAVPGRDCDRPSGVAGRSSARTRGAASPTSSAIACAPGPTSALRGRMPALRVIFATSSRWSGATSVTTSPVGAGACRTPGAVHVGLVLRRRVDVHDEGDVVDVDAARGDVGGDQDADLAVAEAARLRSRAPWLRLPCSSAAGMPAVVSWRDEPCAPSAWCG